MQEEGELIFRFIYEYLIAKPFDRLWISSLTDKAIKEGLAHLQSGAAYDNLYYAARARSEADWLVGINAHPSHIHCGRKRHLLLGQGADSDPLYGLLPFLGEQEVRAAAILATQPCRKGR